MLTSWQYLLGLRQLSENANALSSSFLAIRHCFSQVLRKLKTLPRSQKTTDFSLVFLCVSHIAWQSQAAPWLFLDIVAFSQMPHCMCRLTLCSLAILLHRTAHPCKQVRLCSQKGTLVPCVNQRPCQKTKEPQRNLWFFLCVKILKIFLKNH